jgi:hypothetical protein
VDIDYGASRRTGWAKSSFSNSSRPNCVEVKLLPGGVLVRDSKSPAGPWLLFTHAEWDAFIRGVHAGEFDPAA